MWNRCDGFKPLVDCEDCRWQREAWSCWWGHKMKAVTLPEMQCHRSQGQIVSDGSCQRRFLSRCPTLVTHRCQDFIISMSWFISRPKSRYVRWDHAVVGTADRRVKLSRPNSTYTCEATSLENCESHWLAKASVLPRVAIHIETKCELDSCFFAATSSSPWVPILCRDAGWQEDGAICKYT